MLSASRDNYPESYRHCYLIIGKKQLLCLDPSLADKAELLKKYYICVNRNLDYVNNNVNMGSKVLCEKSNILENSLPLFIPYAVDYSKLSQSSINSNEVYYYKNDGRVLATDINAGICLIQESVLLDDLAKEISNQSRVDVIQGIKADYYTLKALQNHKYRPLIEVDRRIKMIQKGEEGFSKSEINKYFHPVFLRNSKEQSTKLKCSDLSALDCFLNTDMVYLSGDSNSQFAYFVLGKKSLFHLLQGDNEKKEGIIPRNMYVCWNRRPRNLDYELNNIYVASNFYAGLEREGLRDMPIYIKPKEKLYIRVGDNFNQGCLLDYQNSIHMPFCVNNLTFVDPSIIQEDLRNSNNIELFNNLLPQKKFAKINRVTIQRIISVRSTLNQCERMESLNRWRYLDSDRVPSESFQWDLKPDFTNL